MLQIKQLLQKKVLAGHTARFHEGMFALDQDINTFVVTLRRFGCTDVINAVTDVTRFFRESGRSDWELSLGCGLPYVHVSAIKASSQFPMSVRTYTKIADYRGMSILEMLNDRGEIKPSPQPKRIFDAESPKSFTLDFAHTCRDTRIWAGEYATVRELFDDRGIMARSTVRTFEEFGMTNNTKLSRWREVAEAYDVLKMTDVSFGDRLLEVLEFNEMTLTDLSSLTRPSVEQYEMYIADDEMCISAFVRICCALDISPYEFFEREDVYLEDRV